MSTEGLRDGARQTADVVIVGGGVIGLAIARELALRGIRDVTVLERAHPGAEASSAAAGILAPQVEAVHADVFFQLACASRDNYLDFAAALQQETEIDVELDTTGVLYLGFTEEDENELSNRYKWQTSQNLQVDRLNAAEVRRLEPQIAANVVCALRFPNDFQIENRLLIAALTRANEKLGVRVMPNCEVKSLVNRGERIEGVETSDGVISTRVVIIAAGAWCSSIGNVRPPVKIEPVRGQMLCFRHSSILTRHLLYSTRGYLVPRRDGRLLAGSTSEQVGFEKRVTAEGTALIKGMAAEIIPMLANLSFVDSWAGFRPRADDGLPVLGPSEEIAGLFFAMGHYRNGILLAPITAQLIADAIEGLSSPFLLSFSPGRFRSLSAATS
jgi:glycine oxidase